MIYHILSKFDWETALVQRSYSPPSLTREGFIHFSNLSQVAATADRFYRGAPGLLLLCVDESRLASDLRIEPGADKPDELFPHLYGPLNLDAVAAIYELAPRADGTFVLPQVLREDEQ